MPDGREFGDPTAKVYGDFKILPPTVRSEIHSITEPTHCCVTYGWLRPVRQLPVFTDHAVLDNPISSAIIRRVSIETRVKIGLLIHPWNTPVCRTNGCGRFDGIRAIQIHRCVCSLCQSEVPVLACLRPVPEPASTP